MLNAPFSELAEWVSQTYNVKVLNIIYDRVIPDSRPRLQIILEWEDDRKKFIEGATGNFKELIQNEIRDKFVEIVNRDNLYQFACEFLFVVFSSFEPIAREEANSKVSDKEIENLEKELNNCDIWKIRPIFGSVIFFFYKKSQVKKYKKLNVASEYLDKYLKIVKKHDEFGYFDRNNISIELDSKENFEKTYKGSWFNYDR